MSSAGLRISALVDLLTFYGLSNSLCHFDDSVYPENTPCTCVKGTEIDVILLHVIINYYYKVLPEPQGSTGRR